MRCTSRSTGLGAAPSGCHLDRKQAANFCGRQSSGGGECVGVRVGGWGEARAGGATPGRAGNSQLTGRPVGSPQRQRASASLISCLLMTSPPPTLQQPGAALAHRIARLCQRLHLLRLERGHGHALHAVPELAAAGRQRACMCGRAHRGQLQAAVAAAAAYAGCTPTLPHSLHAAAHGAHEDVEVGDDILGALRKEGAVAGGPRQFGGRPSNPRSPARAPGSRS